MRKNIVLIFTKILYILFIVGTIVLLFISNKHIDIDNDIAFKFGMSYFFLTLFMLLYVPFITILNSRKLKFHKIRKRLFKFFAMLILFGTLNYAFDYVYRPSKIDLLREFSTALGVVFGWCFIDITFLKNKEN
ncbi:hypothetical protein [Clostridium sp. JN-1]|uniref:hypothetical protein n=1 Tax=Clostridium sp. JN-1 TaxID=2483110 RepID=UPI000F0B972B|nr:hypothetical protein [Clostridium sp. JN-1]